MTLEQFLDHLQSHNWDIDGLIIIVEPFLSITEKNNIWYSHGFCYISCQSVSKSCISGYTGKSELPMVMEEEGDCFNELLTAQLDELFNSKNIKAKYSIKPVVPFDMNLIEK